MARTLILLRHAKSAWPEGVPDHDRPLGPRGRRDAPAAGRWLRLAGYVPDHVVCSTARRARETWQLAAAELGVQPLVRFEPDVYGAAAAGLLELIRLLPPAARTVIVVGHDPALPEVALALTGEQKATRGPASGAAPADELDRLRAKFPTAAIAVLEFSGPWSALRPGSARLAAFVTPREMERRYAGETG
jgi:phosphohistidine phosphatase